VRTIVSLVSVALLLGVRSSVAQDAPAITSVQQTLQTWLETERAIAASEAEWKAQQTILEDMLSLLRAEAANVTARLEAIEAEVDGTDEARASLNARNEVLDASLASLATALPAFEAQVSRLAERLPAPLLAELAPLLRRLPQEGETTLSVTERLLTVVGLLNRVDKFNGVVTVVSEIRNVGDSSREVDTLYFGLAAAYFSDAAGKFAGVGRPTDAGWVWEERPEIGPEAAALIAAYQGTREARFAVLPLVSE
jgi:septal ring factor EnvC (AmiA/AmiB activator)